MKAFQILPEGYGQICTIDLQKDKKTALAVNLLAVAIAVVLIAAMCFIVPLSSLFAGVDEALTVALRLFLVAFLTIVYLVLHEAVHGIAMKLCGTKKIAYGFTMTYAYAGSKDFYDRSAYIFIALAPVVLWGVVLAVVCLLVPAGWFWPIYIIQVVNLSGAAGDLFVTAKILRLPKDVLVCDTGVSTTVYHRAQEAGKARRIRSAAKVDRGRRSASARRTRLGGSRGVRAAYQKRERSRKPPRIVAAKRNDRRETAAAYAAAVRRTPRRRQKTESFGRSPVHRTGGLCVFSDPAK